MENHIKYISLKILFLTTSNLTTNPRLLKEIKLLQNGNECSFVGFKLGTWADELEDRLIRKYPKIHFHYLSAIRKPYLPWLISSVVQYLARQTYRLFQKSKRINAYASDKRSFILVQFLKKTKKKYDLVIAHNLGALYPAWKFGRQSQTNFAFDIEDFHPGEKIAKGGQQEKQRREFLMKSLLPEACYISYASPLIGRYSLALIGEEKIKNHILINNSFELSELNKPKQTTGKLKLVWFSQYVDEGRGLEKILPILDNYRDSIELHLIGHQRNLFFERYLSNRAYIVNHGTMPQSELHLLLSEFDIGLALESIDQDQNRDICLTNKLFAYVQAGLHVMATDTTGQRHFLEYYPWVGQLVRQDLSNASQTMDTILTEIESLRRGKIFRFNKATELEWENEGNKITSMISKLV